MGCETPFCYGRAGFPLVLPLWRRGLVKWKFRNLMRIRLDHDAT